MFLQIKKILKENSSLIAAIGASLYIFTLLGFNINILDFYKSLTLESKILFIGLLNFIITILASVFILDRISNMKIKK